MSLSMYSRGLANSYHGLSLAPCRRDKSIQKQFFPWMFPWCKTECLLSVYLCVPFWALEIQPSGLKEASGKSRIYIYIIYLHLQISTFVLSFSFFFVFIILLDTYIVSFTNVPHFSVYTHLRKCTEICRLIYTNICSNMYTWIYVPLLSCKCMPTKNVCPVWIFT